VWHTGTIDVTTLASCAGPGTNRQCQYFETVGGNTGLRRWIELLKTPIMQKVNQCPPDVCQGDLSVSCSTTQDCVDQGVGGPCIAIADPICGDRRDEEGSPVFTVEFLEWAWNMAIDLPDNLAGMSAELDTDIESVNPSNLDAYPYYWSVWGPLGATSEGLYDKNLFAPTHHCELDPRVICGDDFDCDPPLFEPSIGPCVDAGATVVTKAGLGRPNAKNSCFFDGPTHLPTGLAGPADNDRNDSGTCAGDPAVRCRWDSECVDAGTTGPCEPIPGVCVGDSTFVAGEYIGGTPCLTDQDCDTAGACDNVTTTCACSAIDTYVTQAGPIRNSGIPISRWRPLSDRYGLAGRSFQGALGFITLEGTIDQQPQAGFGVAIDDMVAQWREFDLQQDTTECDPASGGGSCASIQIEQTRIFEGSAIVRVTILDSHPYDPSTDLNDCDLDGAYEQTDDCNDNGIPDVVALARSESADQEVIILDQKSPGAYEGTISVSTSYDVDPGVLFLAASGTDSPTVFVQYLDRDDGTGNVCPNHLDPEVEGTIEVRSTVFLTRGTVIVKGARITNDVACPASGCDGDGDSFADTNETNRMYITVINKTDIDLSRVVARVDTEDTDKIECITKSFVNIGSLAKEQELEVAEPFVFKVRSDAERSHVDDDYDATFQITMAADQFDTLLRVQKVTIPLDLDVVASPGSPTVFSEGFEGGVIEASQFTEMPLDENMATLELSDGYRCQYADCDGPNPNYADCGNCFLGFINAADNHYDWHIHTTSQVDGGRAYTASNSLHWGVHETDPARDTCRFKQLDAIRTEDPINLAADEIPELSLKHQISLMDGRSSNTPYGESVDRAVVHVQKMDLSDPPNPVGSWIKVYPYHNLYDVQGTDIFDNCTFDPVDDGNDEDDFFDPSDPNRRLGPSSTCFPEFVFGYQGDTDWRNTFDSTAIGRASDPPGLQGQIDRGTWVETRFNLARFVGRRIRLRFLTTSIEAGEAITYNNTQIGDDNLTGDDGWYIDEVVVTGARTAPVELAHDTKDNTGFPDCGVTCGMVTPVLEAEPTSLTAPGQVTELTAAGSFADQCTGGVLQYRFWEDTDRNDVLGDPVDLVLRDWTDNAVYVASPGLTTRYGVEVRCSSAPDTCNGATTETVTVECPSHVAFKGADEPMTEQVRFRADKSTIEWATVQFVDVIRGNLDALRAAGNFTSSVEACIANDQNVDSVAASASPTGSNLYYLVRGRSLQLTACNEIGGYTTGSDAVDRDAQLAAAPVICP
jgi:hypothetical protein